MERRIVMTKIEKETFYTYKSALENEVKKYLNIVKIHEYIDEYNFGNCEVIFDLPYDFHYKISFDYIDQMMITDWSMQQCGYRIVTEIRESFLKNTINK
jgi:hypothetical protein